MPTILITGASRGLGFEFVTQYVADGWDVIATCRDPVKADALQKLKTAHHSLRIEALDVLDAASIKALAATLHDTGIDVLINNAGIYGDKGKGQQFGSLDAADWEQVLRTNTIAPIMLAEALLPNVLRGAQKKLVFITSVMGSINEASGGAILYRSSKAALNAAYHNIALTLKPQGVHVIGLHPGWVKTDMGGTGADITPEVSIKGMRKVIAELTAEQSGGFYAYDGREIGW